MLRLAIVGLIVCWVAAGAELVVGPAGAALLTRCGAAGSEVTQLAAGSLVKLRFSLAGTDSACYSVMARQDDTVLRGYVAREALDGLEAYEDDRRETALRVISTPTPVRPAAREAVAGVAESPELRESLRRASLAAKDNKPLDVLKILDAEGIPDDHLGVVNARARAYLRMTRAAEAEGILKPALAADPNNIGLLYLMATAVYQQNELAEATRLLDRALAIRWEPSVEQLRMRIGREAAGSSSDARSEGSRFTLLYEGEALPAPVARKLIDEFEREVNRISFELGCRVTDRLQVIVQSRDNYREANGVKKWTGGHYDGRIHIAVPPGGAVDDYVRETFSHEFVHACLARKGQWPIWIHEGLAQRLEGRRLTSSDIDRLKTAGGNGRLPKLGATGGAWSGLSAQRARLAYDFALFAADQLYGKHGAIGVRNLLNNPHTLAAFAAQLDRQVRDELGNP